METIDTTINLDSPMFPHFWEAALSIAAFWEAALLMAAPTVAALLEGCVFGRLRF